MKHFASLVVAGGLLAGVLGCSSAQDTPPIATAAELTSATPEADAASDPTLVSLKVPNMFCEVCAAAIEDDLVKIDGVEEIKTDPESRICTFRLANPDVDYKAKLAEFAESNTHLAGYEVQ